MSMKRICAISSWISFLISVDISRMRLGIERERHRKAECTCGNKDRQNPFGLGIAEHYRRADLDDEPGHYCIAARDAINLPLFQLTEERVHLGPRRLRSIGYLSADVERAISSCRQLLQLPRTIGTVVSVTSAIRWPESRLQIYRAAIYRFGAFVREFFGAKTFCTSASKRGLPRRSSS